MFRLYRLKLTRPDGAPHTVIVDQLVDWTPAKEDQKPHIDAQTMITTTGGLFFVKETVEEISQLITKSEKDWT